MKKSTTKKRKVKTPEIVVRVTAPALPTTDELAQPMMDGKALSLPKTWLSDKQILRMVQRTPREHIYTRPAKGGGEWRYVTGAYIEKVLNFVFGFLWDFEVVSTEEKHGQVIVRGKLTVKSPDGKTIVKMQTGRADIKYKRGTKEVLDYGNDEKAATTDSLKKCASLFGIASDIYAPAEYKGETGKEPKNTEESGHQEKIIDAETNEPIEYLCHGATKSGCGADITEQEYEFSKRMFNKPLCRGCQKRLKEAK